MRTIVVFLAAWASLAGAQERERLPMEDMRLFGEVYGVMRRYYVQAIDHPVLIRSAIEGLLKMDPYGAFLSPEEFRELQAGPRPDVASIGVEVLEREGGVRIVAPLEGSPASRAGLKPYDRILNIDGIDVREMRVSEAFKLLRGEAGTTTRLTIQRRGEMEPRQVSVVREVIRTRAVRSRHLDSGVAYLRITRFGEGTAQTVARELGALFARGEPQLLILDLRASPGGLLSSCVATAALFVPLNAPIVKVEGRTPDSRREFRATPQDYLRRGETDPRAAAPEAARSVRIAVLVDGGTASGAEFLAAALRDNKRAILVGSQTFGRGAVQTIFPLGPGDGAAALKLTTAFYQSPGGIPFEGVGLRPDLALAAEFSPEDFGGDGDVVLHTAIEHFLGKRQRRAPSSAGAAPYETSPPAGTTAAPLEMSRSIRSAL